MGLVSFGAANETLWQKPSKDCIFTSIYIYIERERERESDREGLKLLPRETWVWDFCSSKMKSRRVAVVNFEEMDRRLLDSQKFWNGMSTEWKWNELTIEDSIQMPIKNDMSSGLLFESLLSSKKTQAADTRYAAEGVKKFVMFVLERVN